jgi:hypothetical protein
VEEPSQQGQASNEATRKLAQCAFSPNPVMPDARGDDRQET